MIAAQVLYRCAPPETLNRVPANCVKTKGYRDSPDTERLLSSWLCCHRAKPLLTLQGVILHVAVAWQNYSITSAWSVSAKEKPTGTLHFLHSISTSPDPATCQCLCSGDFGRHLRKGLKHKVLFHAPNILREKGSWHSEDELGRCMWHWRLTTHPFSFSSLKMPNPLPHTKFRQAE